MENNFVYKRERKKKSYKKLIQNQRGEGKAVERERAQKEVFKFKTYIFQEKKSCILRGKQVSTLLLWLTKCERERGSSSTSNREDQTR